jgi:PhoH-like ATPase
MTRKTYVLDTNVLLHDPAAIEKFQDNEVVIPLVVLEDLDKLKQFTDELGKNARFVLRYIDQLTDKGNLHKGIEIAQRNICFRVLVELKNTGKKDFPLPLETSGNKILLAAFQLKHMDCDVTLVSKDFFMRVKAGAIGIEAQDYENLKQSYENIYKGITKAEVSKKEMDQFFTTGSLQINKKLCPNEYCILNTPGGESSSIGWFSGRKNRLEPIFGYDGDIWGITPLNTEQRCAFDLLLRDDVHLVTLIGPAGTGKTLLALACGLKTVFDEDRYRKLLISRPIMPLGRDIGYLPGTKEEKLYHWMQPIYDNLEFLCEFSIGEGNGSETKKWIAESKKFEMEAVTYIRGRTLPKMYIIIDEAQNLSPHEVKTIISRAGHGTKVILTGDPTQIDNPYLDKDSNALTYVVGRFKDHALFGHIFLEKTERSELASLAAEVLL